MALPKNKTVGHCLCRKCRGTVADIRRAKNHERGARYLDCSRCGTDIVKGRAHQVELDTWIDANIVETESENLETDSSLESKPVSENLEDDSKLITAAKPAITPDASKPGSGFFKEANNQLNELMQE